MFSNGIVYASLTYADMRTGARLQKICVYCVESVDLILKGIARVFI